MDNTAQPPSVAHSARRDKLLSSLKQAIHDKAKSGFVGSKLGEEIIEHVYWLCHHCGPEYAWELDGMKEAFHEFLGSLKKGQPTTWMKNYIDRYLDGERLSPEDFDQKVKNENDKNRCKRSKLFYLGVLSDKTTRPKLDHAVFTKFEDNNQPSPLGEGEFFHKICL